MSKLISKNEKSTISYGSEFREAALLHLLLWDHPLWGFLRKTLEDGAEFEFTSKQNNADRMLENTALIDYGNHKLANNNDDVIWKSLLSKVNYAFAFVIPLETINKIPHSMVMPLGIANQFTIDSGGNRIPKRRLTHDQTYHHLEAENRPTTSLTRTYCLRSSTATASSASSITSSLSDSTFQA